MKIKLTSLMRRSGLFFNFFALFVLFFSASLAFAKIFEKPDDALKRVFPDAKVEVKNIVLSGEQIKKAEKLSGVKLKTKLVSFYVARKNNEVTGYAYVDSHIVRTKMQTVMYVLTPEGGIDRIEILSFYEPLEYLADARWLKTFQGKKLGKNLIRLRRDVVNISGATLTARAITDNTRKALALWNVIFGEQE